MADDEKMADKPTVQTHAEAIRTIIACIAMTAQILVLLRVFDLI